MITAACSDVAHATVREALNNLLPRPLQVTEIAQGVDTGLRRYDEISHLFSNSLNMHNRKHTHHPTQRCHTVHPVFHPALFGEQRNRR